MLCGDFASAWSISDRILGERIARGEQCFHWPRHLQYVWRGDSLRDRRVLVRCYHGLGDTIQFVRLLAPLRKQARHTTLWAQPALLELLASVAGIDELLPLHDGRPECDYDVDIELMELAHFFRLTADSIPARVPYIYESFARKRFDTRHGLHVGLAWQSGDWNPNRSLPIELVGELGHVRGVHWYSLQHDAEPLPFDARQMVDTDLALTARRMLSLDLVISVDTVTAHLAGALALPVWTLLPHECDWRWMSCGERSPWYPTMRLVRQPRAGDWQSVIAAVTAALDIRLSNVASERLFLDELSIRLDGASSHADAATRW